MRTPPPPAVRPLIIVGALALLLPLLLALPAAAQPTGVAGFDGDPATTERVQAETPIGAAVEVSQQRFDAAGGAGRQAAHAVVATVEDFADSLAGAALTSDGPLLLTPSDQLDDATDEELQRVLASGATVYVLGGAAAISPQVADAITALGYQVQRVAGETRVETALAVADEARRLTPSSTVLLARSEGAAGNPTSAWADSMTGGSLAAAARVPIVVTPTGALHPAVAGWLTDNAPDLTVLLGGEAALTDAVADAVPGATQRLAGPERSATAAAIANSTLWPRSDQRRFVVLDGGRADGWAFGLSAAGLAADAGAPPLMVVGDVTASTRREVSTCGAPDVDLLLVGGESIIAADIESALTDFDGQACATAFNALDPFDDCTQTLSFFRDEALSRVGPYGLDGHYYGGPLPVEVLSEPVPTDDAVEESGGEPAPAPAAGEDGAQADGDSDAGSGGGDEAVSETNVQEVGVDEPDTVKVTAQAAYVARGAGIEVVALADGQAPTHVRTLDVPSPGDAPIFGHELLVDGDVLLVLGRGDGYVVPVADAPASTDFAPPYFFPDPTTTIARFDISDRTNPVLLDSTVIDGDYRSARMVEGTLRLVTSANPTGLHFVFPGDGSQEAMDAALEHNREVIQQSTLDNWLPAVQGQGQAVDCGDVFAPPGFSGLSTLLVSTIDVGASSSPTSSAALVAQAETIYASTDRLVVSSSQWGSWSADEAQPEQVSTKLHSFDITDPAATTYVASGEVDGYVLNSFAISERNRYYRIATTTEPPFFEGPQGGPQTDNGVTVLTEGGGELFEVGRVFGLGAGERIFAVRYLGDVAAVVTFRQVDPLYLVDLSNPAAPRVTGELKINGVSRYLHPLGEDHLLGVGQDGDDEGRLTGLQVNLFDISDRANPTRVDSIEFGPGDSPVEFDHKAFLFWGPLQRALVPSTTYGQDFEQFDTAVQAIDVSTDAGTITLAGAVRQGLEESSFRSAVQRTFIAGGTLYTVSDAGVSAHDLVALTDFGAAAFPQQEGCCVSDGGGEPEPAPPGQG